MISNSVTHLWSYTNSAIAGSSAQILPVTPHDRRAERRRLCAECRRLCAECRRLCAECRRLCQALTSLPRAPMSLRQARTSLRRAPISSHWMTSVRSPRQAPTSSHWMTSVRAFHDVSQYLFCFTSGSWCFTSGHDVSQCFTCVS